MKACSQNELDPWGVALVLVVVALLALGWFLTKR